MENNHLSSDDVISILKKFYRNEASKEKLIEEYQLEISPLKTQAFYKSLPDPQIDIECELCRTTCVAKWERPSRSQRYEPTYDKKSVICPECEHYAFNEECRCERCYAIEQKIKLQRLEEKQRVDDRKKEIIRKRTESLKPCSAQELDVDQRIFLGCLIQQSTSEQIDLLTPISDSIEKFYPLTEYRRLFKVFEKILDYVSPVEPLDEISLLDSDQLQWYGTECYHRINPTLGRDLFVNTDIYNDIYDNIFNISQVNFIIKDIMIQECINQLNLTKQKYGFEIVYGEKEEEIFFQLLQEYTIAEIFSIIWTGCKNAVSFYQSSRMNKTSASKSCITFVKKYCEKIKQNNWSIKSFDRNIKNQESIISNYIMRKVLKIECDIINYKFTDIAVKTENFNIEYLKSNEFTIFDKEVK